ncbi:proton extrusion protein PcxA [Oscillatoria sp. FACHB-1406]|uniref:proton extrusion protein PcxA n=1 Tax=Oscillatoria sp. FACHB-1406 TaxID=2692846 RepID=UPI001685624D|nr:proton extrusion protein PcxA [Oscillatoria sp. FACHB-1406]MBD2579156.1 proton extrusion protein PcxA [Oscillatoria sp. FACHB-1406]
MKVPPLFKKAQRWFFSTPDRALDRAYRSALAIKALEDEYFEGGMVSPESSSYSEAVIAYCRAEVRKNLGIINSSLAEFKTTRSVLSLADLDKGIADKVYDLEFRERSGIVIEKINFIDSVVRKYKVSRQSKDKIAVSLVEIPKKPPQSQRQIVPSEPRMPAIIDPMDKRPNNKEKVETISDKAGVLPRSLLKTFSRIQREIDPQSQESEEEILKKFRQSRDRTAISIRFLLILVIVPLLVHQLSKTFLISPLVEQSLFTESTETIFLNEDMQKEAIEELKAFEESLHFRSLLGIGPSLSAEEMETEVKHKAEELAEDYRGRGSTAIANIFADVCSLIAFTAVVFASRKEIAILKSFIDELIYGLSDSAKSFLIILFTDMFVGFHSPHGWEVILEGVARHFGLPESRDFNFLFIATFPVILDTVLKYWIFRYLNRISPSAVATYKTMNE